MGRAPCCDKANVKKGPWSPEEDAKLKEYIEKQGTGGNWIALPQKAGLRRCGKSCRLRWLNYLRPNIRHGEFSKDEDRIICSLFASIGSRWSIIAAQLPGRTDNDIKNYWNTKLKKKLMGIGMVPSSQKRPHQATTYPAYSSFSAAAPYKCSNNTCYTTTQTSSLTGYEPISMPSNTTVLQAQEGYVDQVHQHQVKQSVLMFAGEASCSSSDGSCSNQISHGREILEHDYGVSNGELQSLLYHGVDENQKFMLSNWCPPEKPNGLYGETTPVDYSSLEEIKQLISTNISNNLNFFVDEIKTEEKMVYY